MESKIITLSALSQILSNFKIRPKVVFAILEREFVNPANYLRTAKAWGEGILIAGVNPGDGISSEENANFLNLYEDINFILKLENVSEVEVVTKLKPFIVLFQNKDEYTNAVDTLKRYCSNVGFYDERNTIIS